MLCTSPSCLNDRFAGAAQKWKALSRMKFGGLARKLQRLPPRITIFFQEDFIRVHVVFYEDADEAGPGAPRALAHTDLEHSRMQLLQRLEGLNCPFARIINQVKQPSTSRIYGQISALRLCDTETNLSNSSLGWMNYLFALHYQSFTTSVCSCVSTSEIRLQIMINKPSSSEVADEAVQTAYWM